MPSIGHIAVGMACGRAYSADDAIAKKAAIAFSIVALWPDADAVGFLFGVKYSDPFGHRGATHSIPVALLVGLASILIAKKNDLPVLRTFVFTTIAAVSHGLLDTLTFGGGLGCALWWPFSTMRFWSPVRFIPIAPIGIALLSARGLYVMLAELLIFAPFWIFAIMPRRSGARG